MRHLRPRELSQSESHHQDREFLTVMNDIRTTTSLGRYIGIGHIKTRDIKETSLAYDITTANLSTYRGANLSRQRRIVGKTFKYTLIQSAH